MKSPASGDARQNLLHVGAEDPNPEHAEDGAEQPAAEAAASSDDRDVDLGSSGGAGLEPVAPLATGRPRIGLDRGDDDLSGAGIPLVPVALPGEDVALGDLGPARPLVVDPEVAVVDVRPDDWPAIAEIRQHAEDPVGRERGDDPKTKGRHYAIKPAA